ncbi:MAG: hypothetical protein WAL55_12540 [Candidatus Acidiferrales bacterium]
MKPAAIGVRMHSGWGAVVTVSGAADAVEIVDRRRIDVIDAKTPGAKQPYHFARDLGLPEGEKHLARCVAASGRLALAALREIIEELTARDYCVTGCAVVLASGRALPPLTEILAAHPLIHTAEGEFFRESVRSACEHLEIKVTGIRERELEERAKAAFGKSAAAAVTKRIANMGKTLGSPWTQDHKKAALAAWMVLSKKQ